ncbi:diphthine synthase [Candidatus Bathyarchaeota archaeon]|nr:diphthine synthase [Candidatus Bathyarchaeota archaeon]
MVTLIVFVLEERKGYVSNKTLNELVFIGLGLYDEKDISLRGLEELKEADTVFAEFYTSLMPGLSIKKLEEMIGKPVRVVSRRVLEEEDGQIIFEAAKKGKAAFLVQGDPMIATTHVDLRISAEKRGIKTRVVHGASAVSAVRGISGLQNYKFGKAVTIPFSEEGFVSETPYKVIIENKKMGLHTMCYLDIKAEEQRYLTVNEALQTLLELEKQKKEQVATSMTLVIGVARAGSPEPIVKAGYLEDVIEYDFGAPPHTLIFPGKLHFMEAEALIALADAPQEVMEMAE